MTRRIFTIVAVLAAAFALRLWLNHDVHSPVPNLDSLPRQIGNWHTVREGISAQSASALRADSLILREYELAPGARIQLFIAYYSTQQAGESMHSPRNCLPGSGWEPIARSGISANLGTAENATVNRYVIEKDGNRMLIVYWYQEHDRVIADEYAGKLYLMWDSIRKQQRDGAIVRLGVPLRTGLTEDEALTQVRAFIRLAAPQIKRTLFATSGQS